MDKRPSTKPRFGRAVRLALTLAAAGWIAFWMAAALEHRGAATAAYRAAGAIEDARRSPIYVEHRHAEEFAVAMAFGVPLIGVIAFLCGSYVAGGLRRRGVTPLAAE